MSFNMASMYPVNRTLPFYSSILILGLLRYYPLNTKQYNEKSFLRFLYIWMGLWSGNVLNVSTLFFTNLFSGNFSDFTEDLAFFVGHTGCMLSCLFFALHHKEWSDLFKGIATYNEFGKPPKYDKVKKFADKYATMFMMYGFAGTWMLSAIVLVTEDRCDKHYNGRRICGMLNPTWWPSQVKMTLLSKRLFLLYQVLSVCTISCFSVIVLLPYQVGEFIIARVDHLAILIGEICLIDDEEEQFQKFRMWIEYHIDTIRLCEKLNFVSKRTVGHVSLIVAIILASLGHQVMSTYYYISHGAVWAVFTNMYYIPNQKYRSWANLEDFFLSQLALGSDTSTKAILYLIEYFIAVCIICHAGQRIENQMMIVGNSIYLSQWYRCSKRVKKLIPFIIKRSQRRVGIDALPIGKANYVLLVMVLKTSYSYLALLNQTM